MFRRLSFCAALTAAILAAPAMAFAQAFRVGATLDLGATTAPVVQPDVAYDFKNDRYLSVAGNVFIDGRIVTSGGTVLKTFTIFLTSEYAQSPRVTYSPDLAGGAGGFFVTWHLSMPGYTSVWGRLVGADGTLLTPPFVVSTGATSKFTSTNHTMGAPVAYSTTSKEFLVAWMGNASVAAGASGTDDILFQRIDTSGTLISGNTLVSGGTRDSLDREPALAYNPDADEFYIAYNTFVESRKVGFAAGRRVKAGTGAFVGATQSFNETGSARIPAVTYNTATRQYLLGWYNVSRSGTAVYGVVLNGADAVQVGDLRVLSAFYSAYDALDIDYNPPSGQYLLVTLSQSHENAAVSITDKGFGYDNGFLATATNVIGNFNPRMAPSTKDKRWLLVTASGFRRTAGQFLGSDATGANPTTPKKLTKKKSDFNGDGKADVATFRSSTGTWSINGQQGDTWGRAGDLPVPADYNGDGKIEVAIFRPSTGQWWIRDTGVIDYGLPGDIPVPADYDGDGKDDVAVFRPSAGLWFVRGTAGSVRWGSPGDIPVPGDYDGDGKIDIAVFRRATGSWWIVGQPRIDYGRPGDIPVPGDFNGDGKTDIAVYRPSAGLWFARNLFVETFGSAGLLPMALDMDGDGKDELVLFQSATATWRVKNRVSGALTTLIHGAAGDQVTSPALLTMFPAAGDADGDRRADPTVFRPSTSTWFSRRSSDGGYTPVSFGLAGDVPVPADYDGDGKLDYAVFRSATGTWFVTRSSNNFSTYSVSEPWGAPGDVVLPGDYDGDGRADLAVYRPSIGFWYIKESSTDFVTSVTLPWGAPGDVPVPADYDGDGRLDPAIYRPSQGLWYIHFLASDTWTVRAWGVAGDTPIAADFDGDGLADMGIYRPSTGRWYIQNSASGNMTVADWGLAGDVPLAADFNGDGQADIVVVRQSTGQWFILNPLTGGFAIQEWGIPGDTIAIGR